METVPFEARWSKVGTDDAGALPLLARFFRAMLLNLLKDPCKLGLLEKMDMAVGVDPTGHPDQALTLVFRGGMVRLENGVSPHAHLVLRGEPAALMKLARMPAGPEALLFLASYEGRDIARRMLTRELAVRGMVRHPLRMLRFSRFMAPSGG